MAFRIVDEVTRRALVDALATIIEESSFAVYADIGIAKRAV